MRVHAITLGCQMSASDGAETLARLRDRGWNSAAAMDDADVIFMTTCSVRRHAEQRALSLIGRLREWKARDPRRVLIVGGCVAERLGPRLLHRFPHVDLAVGAKSAGRYAEIVAQELEQRAGKPRLSQNSGYGKEVCQHLTIMRGCGCNCAYCVVPLVRGPEVCRPAAEILAEARARIESGARELTLLGQRVNAYADVSGGQRVDFADLLRLVDALPGLRRLRFMSPHPALCDERLTAAMRGCPSLCEAIHLPVQSGCDRLLGLMRRGYTRGDMLRTAARLRDAIPGVVIATDIIVGLPSETAAEFAQTLTLLDALRPAAAFCFKYSAREGTAAASLPDDVPPDTKEERLAAVNALVARLSAEALDSQVGRVVEVLAETPDFGRTRTGLKVRWERPVAVGSLVSVRVDRAARRTLLGDIHEPNTP